MHRTIITAVKIAFLTYSSQLLTLFSSPVIVAIWFIYLLFHQSQLCLNWIHTLSHCIPTSKQLHHPTAPMSFSASHQYTQALPTPPARGMLLSPTIHNQYHYTYITTFTPLMAILLALLNPSR